MNTNIAKLIILQADSMKKTKKENQMASSITNVSDINHVTDVKKTKVLSYSEELSKVNKIKYNLSIAYFAGLVVLFTTLLW